jgi:hypothetical protein
MPNLQVTAEEMLFLGIMYQLEGQLEKGEPMTLAMVDDYMRPAAINPERLFEFQLIGPTMTVDGKPLTNTVSLTDAGRNAIDEQLSACIERSSRDIQTATRDREKNPRRAAPEEFTKAREAVKDRLEKFAAWRQSGEQTGESQSVAPKKRGRPKKATA